MTLFCSAYYTKNIILDYLNFYLITANRMEACFSHWFNKDFRSIFHANYEFDRKYSWIQKIQPKKGWRLRRPKHCENTNQDKNSSLNSPNNTNWFILLFKYVNMSSTLIIPYCLIYSYHLRELRSTIIIDNDCQEIDSV